MAITRPPTPINFGPLRQQTIYGQVPMEPSPTMPMPVGAEAPMAPEMQPAMDPTQALFEQMYQPETTATRNFETLMAQMPQRKRPGKLRKLGASLVAIKNPKLAEHFMYAPFEHELEDWKEKMQPAYQAAGLERQENIQKRLYAGDVAKTRIKERETDIKEARANAYILKQQMPDWDFDTKGPEVLAMNPRTKEIVRTGIKTGNLDDASRIALETKGRVEVAKETGTQNRMTVAARSAADLESDAREGWNTYTDKQGNTIQVNDATGETRKVEGVTGPLTKPAAPGRTAAAKKVTMADIKLRAARFKIANPNLSRWISTKGGMVTIAPAKTTRFGTGPTPEERERIAKEIYGDAELIDQGTINTAGQAEPPRPASAPQPQVQRNKKTGQVRISYDGGKTWLMVPPDKVAAITGQ